MPASAVTKFYSLRWSYLPHSASLEAEVFVVNLYDYVRENKGKKGQLQLSKLCPNLVEHRLVILGISDTALGNNLTHPRPTRVE